MSGRLSVPPLVSEVQLLSVGVCMQAPGVEGVLGGFEETWRHRMCHRAILIAIRP